MAPGADRSWREVSNYKKIPNGIYWIRDASPEKMQVFQNLLGVFLITTFGISELAVASEIPAGVRKTELRELVVSHADKKGILQLYRMKEDGSDRRQITHSKRDCQMPACSPDGRKLVYTQQVDHSLAITICDVDGGNARALVKEGMNLLPSWLPDSRHIVWMRSQPGKDPSRNSRIHLMNTETGESRRLFTDPEQLDFSNSMPAVSPKGDLIAFVSNRSGEMRVWVSALNGSSARLVSPPKVEYNEVIDAPIEQKVPVWSPDGKWIAHWEGVEMIHMSKFTGVPNPERDRLISETFHVWVVGSDGKNRRKIGRGDDPTWSHDGFVTRAFPDPKRGGPKVMIETESGEKELPIVPSRRNWGRFSWLPERSDKTEVKKSGTEQPAPAEDLKAE